MRYPLNRGKTKTKLKEIAEAVLREESATQLLERMEPLLDGVGDAALLMATDGYGRGSVKGTEEGRVVVIRTSENQKSFLCDGDPNPQLLFDSANETFLKINKERGLEHP